MKVDVIAFFRIRYDNNCFNARWKRHMLPFLIRSAFFNIFVSLSIIHGLPTLSFLGAGITTHFRCRQHLRVRAVCWHAEGLKHTGTRAKNRYMKTQARIIGVAGAKRLSFRGPKDDVIVRLTSRIAMIEVTLPCCICYSMLPLGPTELQSSLYFTERSHVLGEVTQHQNAMTVRR